MAWIVSLSIVAYIPFYIWDRRHIKDEREQFIELKTSNFQSHATIAALLGLSLAYHLDPSISAGLCLLILVIASLYSEIVGKIYFRWKI